jgi:hypothetical protein
MDDQIIALSELDPNEILYVDDKHFNLGDSKDYVDRIVQGAKDIATHPGFWKELPQPTQRSLRNEAETILKLTQTIRDNKDNTQWLSSELSNYIDGIMSVYNTVYPWFVTAVREYKNSQDTQRQEADALINDLKGATKSAKNASKLATEASARISTTELSRFFDEVANGEPDSRESTKGKHKKTWWLRRTDGYATDARRWFAGVILSILATAVVALAAFWHAEFTSITPEEVFAKALILAAPAYAIKFCAKNYTLNRQLQVTNTHRSVVMKTLLAFMERQEVSDEVRAGVIIEAARQAFKSTDPSGPSEPDSVIEIPVPWKKG